MQSINELGPESTFARDYNINHGRFYLSMPASQLTVTLAPLLVYFDLTPFQGIQAAWWGFGFGASIALFLHGLLATLRSKGFNTGAAIGGAAIAAGASAVLFPGLGPAALASVLAGGYFLGGLISGAVEGVSKYARNTILFAPRNHVERGGVKKGHKTISLRFALSTPAGDGEFSPFAWISMFYDQKFRKFKFISHIEDDGKDGKRVIDESTLNHSILIGSVVTALNVLVMLKLALINVFMLLPSLVYTAGKAVGPFLMKKKIGKQTIFGKVFQYIGFMGGVTTLFGLSVLVKILTLNGPANAGDHMVLLAGATMAILANAIPIWRAVIGWQYRDVPERNIDLQLLGKKFTVGKYLKAALQRHPDNKKQAVQEAVDEALKNAQPSPVREWLFLGKWARMTSEQARGFWAAILIGGWVVIVPKTVAFIAALTKYKFAYPISDVERFLYYGTAGFIAVWAYGKIVSTLENRYWQRKVNNLDKEVEVRFKKAKEAGISYPSWGAEVEALMTGIHMYMGNKEINLVRQSYKEIKELLKSPDGDAGLPVVAVAPTLAPVADRAMQAQEPAPELTAFKMPPIPQLYGADLANPGGIDLGKTKVGVRAPNGGVQAAFDDPTMLRLLLNAQGLTPIIYDIKTMTPSMIDRFVGLGQ